MKNKQRLCAHCQSVALEFYGYIPGGFHFYYVCNNCKKYTEYYYPFKGQIYAAVVTILIFTAFAVTMVIFDQSLSTAVLIFLAITAVLLFFFKYLTSPLVKAIPIAELPASWLIIPAFPKTFSKVVVGLLIIAAVFYFGIFFIHLARQ